MAFRKVTAKGKESKIATVEPIRSKKDIENVQKWFKLNGYEKYALLFKLGCYTGLRVGDLVSFKVKDLYQMERIVMREEKTGKVKIIPLQSKLQKDLNEFCEGRHPDEYVFPSRNPFKKLDTSQVYRMINDACEAVGVKENVGTHTMRKTFGYHHYKQYNNVALLQEIYNHSSPDVTKRYIGITQDEINASYLALDLENEDQSLESLASQGNNRTKIHWILSFLKLYKENKNNNGINMPIVNIIIEIIKYGKIYSDSSQRKSI